jgi:hypothetical protein
LFGAVDIAYAYLETVSALDGVGLFTQGDERAGLEAVAQAGSDAAVFTEQAGDGDIKSRAHRVDLGFLRHHLAVEQALENESPSTARFCQRLSYNLRYYGEITLFQLYPAPRGHSTRAQAWPYFIE